MGGGGGGGGAMIVRTAEVEKGIGILTRGVGVWLSVNADTEPGSDPLSGAHIHTTVSKPGVCESEGVCRDRSGKGGSLLPHKGMVCIWTIAKRAMLHTVFAQFCSHCRANN